MSSLGPETSSLVVQAPYILLPNGATTGLLRATANLDLRSKLEAILHIGIGWYHASGTSLAASVKAFVTPLSYNGPAFAVCEGQYLSGTVGMIRLINNVNGYAIGDSSIAFDGSGGTLCVADDKICLWGVDAVPAVEGALTLGANYPECIDVSYISGTPIKLRAPLKYAKPDNCIITRGSSWAHKLNGGHAYALTFDVGVATANAAIVVWAWIDAIESLTQS
jgi:hypothetical protein